MKKRILLIEDEENQRILYREELTRNGYDVLVAGNGNEGLAVLESEQVDCVVLDIRMPSMDGLETLGTMLGRRKDLPVIIYTAYSHYKNDFMSWAANAYLVKHSDMTELVEKIRELCHG